MTVSIHQPNYIPWLGFFNKVILSDVYVVFDDVQYPRGKDFANRNQIKTNNSTIWLTVPVQNKSELKKWNEIEIRNDGWVSKHLTNIYSFYKKAPYFNNYISGLEDIYKKDYTLLIDFNLDLIRYFLKCINADTKIVLSSDMPTNNKGLDKIIDILTQVKATHYISGKGEGSERYIDAEIFKSHNINLIWQSFQHPTYKQQFGEFIPYMSIIDLLFNEGPNSRDIILNKHIQ